MVKFHVYRGAVGALQIVVTYEFAGMAAWANQHTGEKVQKVWSELHTLGLNVTAERWGPSPVIPKLIRPGG